VTVAVVLLIGAVIVFAIGVIALWSVGPGLRIGRLLSGTRQVPIETALEIARSGEDRYVRTTGRISSDEEFPDDQNRPLVFRRTRLEIRPSGSTWTSVLDEREAVPFGVESRSAHIGIDDAQLADGIVVIPRVSAGTVADLPTDVAADIPAGTNPATPVRLTIDQVSAVEHATVVGRPTMRDGAPIMTSGTGRPLIITTLEQSTAMRVLAAGRRRRVVAGAVLLTAALGLLAGSIVAFVIGI